MAISTVHIFKVWHPKDGLPADGSPPKYEEREFHFTYPISRVEARRIVEKVEGWSIARVRPPREKRVYIHKPRPRKARY